jgi:hypothetical protein
VRIRIFQDEAPRREIRVTSMAEKHFARETFEVAEGCQQALVPVGLASPGP